MESVLYMMERNGYVLQQSSQLEILPIVQDDGTNVSIFEYDFSQRKELAPIAKNALRKLRTTRHPDVLKFMDAVESDTSIFIMTERVRPLQSTLDSWKSKSVQERSDWLLWGLHRISVSYSFVLHNLPNLDWHR